MSDSHFSNVYEGHGESRTGFAQNPAESESNLKFPKNLKHRRQVLARIYVKQTRYSFYQLAYRVNGQRKLKSFRTYAEAKTEGDRLVRELAQGSQASALACTATRI